MSSKMKGRVACLVFFPRKELDRAIVRAKPLGKAARSSGRRHEVTREALRSGFWEDFEGRPRYRSCIFKKL